MLGNYTTMKVNEYLGFVAVELVLLLLRVEFVAISTALEHVLALS